MKTIVSPDGQNLAITKEVILAMQESYMQLSTAVAGIGSQLGNLIINGMVLTGGVYSAGLVIYDGKVMIFEGGVAQSKFDIIDLPAETIVGIDASGNNYQTLIINKVCRFNAAGQYSFNFKNLSNVLVNRNYFLKSFTPIAGTGITVPSGSKVVHSPYLIDIKSYFDVEMSQIANPSQTIKIQGWGYSSDAGYYYPDNRGKVVGTYRLLLKDALSAVKEQLTGDVILHPSEVNTLTLTFPTSKPRIFSTYNFATFEDLGIGNEGLVYSTGVIYPKYSLEIRANIFVNGLKEY